VYLARDAALISFAAQLIAIRNTLSTVPSFLLRHCVFPSFQILRTTLNFRSILSIVVISHPPGLTVINSD